MKKVIYAKTCKQPGCCEVTFGDGTTDVVTKSIGELQEELNATDYSTYYKVGRSSLICGNNIAMIYPAKGVLMLAYDLLGLEHLCLCFSSELLRKLRAGILMQRTLEKI